MLRLALAALAGLVATACTTVGTKVDLVPMADRPAKAPFADGAYCGLEGAAAPFSVMSSDSCATFKWNAKSRQYKVTATGGDAKQTITFSLSVRPLDGGLLLMQMDSSSVTATKASDAEDFKKGPPYIQGVARVSKDAIVMANWTLTEDKLKAFHGKYPTLKFNGESGNEIVTGDVTMIRQYLWARALEVVRTSEGDTFATALVRDKSGAKDHKASAKQMQAFQQGLSHFKDLAKK
jgi:hypothetical protein